MINRNSEKVSLSMENILENSIQIWADSKKNVSLLIAVTEYFHTEGQCHMKHLAQPGVL